MGGQDSGKMSAGTIAFITIGSLISLAILGFVVWITVLHHKPIHVPESLPKYGRT
jgi:dolichol kinase